MSFTVQYTALILIILSFLIGAFIRPEADSLKPTKTEKEITEVVAKKKVASITDISFKDLFNKGSNQLDQNQLTGLIQLLLSHDLRAELTIYGTSTELILSRITKLEEFLSQAGLPLVAYDVKAIKDKNEKQLEVKISKI